MRQVLTTVGTSNLDMNGQVLLLPSLASGTALVVDMGLVGGLLLAAVSAFGQDAPGSTGPQPGVPLDSGASLLLAGGVAYGLKKLRQRRVR